MSWLDQRVNHSVTIFSFLVTGGLQTTFLLLFGGAVVQVMVPVVLPRGDGLALRLLFMLLLVAAVLEDDVDLVRRGSRPPPRLVVLVLLLVDD